MARRYHHCHIKRFTVFTDALHGHVARGGLAVFAKSRRNIRRTIRRHIETANIANHHHGHGISLYREVRARTISPVNFAKVLIFR